MWYSFDQPWKHEKLSRSWSHPVVLNMGPLDWESSALTTRPLDPVWMNESIQSNIKTKNILYKQYIQNGRFESGLVFLETFITELGVLISSTKTLHYENLQKKTK